MSVLRTGEPYLPIAGRGEGCFFDFDNTGPKLIYSYAHPTPDEIKDFSAGSPFEIRFLELGGIIWTTHKCGGQPWNDAPYNPRLSLLTDGFPTLETESDGLALNLILTDAEDAVIKHLRVVGLSYKFSTALLGVAERLRDTPQSLSYYKKALIEIPRKYNSRKLADMATYRCKIHGV